MTIIKLSDHVRSTLPPDATAEELEAEGYDDAVIRWLSPLVGETVCLSIAPKFGRVNRRIGILTEVVFSPRVIIELADCPDPLNGPDQPVNHTTYELGAEASPTPVPHWVRLRKAALPVHSWRGSANR